MKVLIAEDDEITLELLDNMLRTAGCETRTATDGTQGLSLFQSFQPDLVITDIEMPEMNGLEFLAAIREASREAIVIIATGHGSEAYAIRALREGANDYLCKPVDEDVLLPLLGKYAVALESNQRLRKVAQYVMNGEMILRFGNELKMAGEIAEYLASQATSLLKPDALTMVRLALGELITNAIEHGNLEITSEMKAAATQDFGGYFEFLRQRQYDPRFKNRQVTIHSSINQHWCEWKIRDEGPGFDWEQMPADFTMESALVSHGRGILISRFQFDELEYTGTGNTVRVRKYIRRD